MNGGANRAEPRIKYGGRRVGFGGISHDTLLLAAGSFIYWAIVVIPAPFYNGVNSSRNPVSLM
jgi:hypothetical protein